MEGAVAFFNQGLNLYHCNDLSSALLKFDVAIRLDPEDARYFYWRALTRYVLSGQGAGPGLNNALRDMAAGVKLKRAGVTDRRVVGKSLAPIQNGLRAGSNPSEATACLGPAGAFTPPGAAENCVCGGVAVLSR